MAIRAENCAGLTANDGESASLASLAASTVCHSSVANSEFAFAHSDVADIGDTLTGPLILDPGEVMSRPSVLIAGLATAGTLFASTPAIAKPIDNGHVHDVFTSDVYDCEGTPAQDAGDVSGNFVFNQRGSSPFPY